MGSPTAEMGSSEKSKTSDRLAELRGLSPLALCSSVCVMLVGSSCPNRRNVGTPGLQIDHPSSIARGVAKSCVLFGAALLHEIVDGASGDSPGQDTGLLRSLIGTGNDAAAGAGAPSSESSLCILFDSGSPRHESGRLKPRVAQLFHTKHIWTCWACYCALAAKAAPAHPAGA